MSYFKSQVLFLSLLILLYLGLSYALYLVQSEESYQSQRQEYADFLEHRNRVLRGLEYSGTYPNDENKTRVVEWVSRQFVRRLTHALNSKNWEAEASKIELPFKGHSTLCLAKGNRSHSIQGESLEDSFGKAWFQTFLMGLRHGSSYFTSLMQKIYSYPLTLEQFSELDSTFQIFFRKGQFFIGCHIQTDQHFFWLMINLSTLNADEVRRNVALLLASKNPHLQSDWGDQFIWGSKKEFLDSHSYGLHWVGSILDFGGFLKTSTILNLATFILVIFLYASGGPKILTMRFEMRFFLLALSLIFAILLAGNFLHKLYLSEQNIITQGKRQNIRGQTVRTVVKAYNDHLHALKKSIAKTFNSTQVLPLDLGKTGQAIYLDATGTLKTLNSGANPINFYRLGKLLTLLLPQLNWKSKDLEQGLIHRVDRLMSSFTHPLLAEFTSKKSSLGSLHFLQKTLLDPRNKGQLVKWKAGGHFRYLLFLFKEDRNRPMLLLCSLDTNAIVESFFSNLQSESSNSSGENSLILFQPSSRKILWQRGDWRPSALETLNRWSIARFSTENTGTSAEDNIAFHEHLAIPGTIFLFHGKKEVDLQFSERITSMHTLFFLSFLLMALPLLWALRSRLLRPLLAINATFKRFNLNQELTSLDLGAPHEGGRMLRAFKSMVISETHRRNARIPVQRSLVDVLREPSGQIGSFYRGYGCVISLQFHFQEDSLEETAQLRDYASLVNIFLGQWAELGEKYGAVLELLTSSRIRMAHFQKLSPQPIQNALQIATEILSEFETLSQGLRPCPHAPGIRIGVASGEVCLGFAINPIRTHILLGGEALLNADHLCHSFSTLEGNAILVSQEVRNRESHGYSFHPCSMSFTSEAPQAWIFEPTPESESI
jgi:hypothetical protein